VAESKTMFALVRASRRRCFSGGTASGAVPPLQSTQQSFVARGRAFEDAVVEALLPHGFRVRRAGGPYDGGVDVKVCCAHVSDES
jgi:hypothetical protein